MLPTDRDALTLVFLRDPPDKALAIRDREQRVQRCLRAAGIDEPARRASNCTGKRSACAARLSSERPAGAKRLVGEDNS